MEKTANFAGDDSQENLVRIFSIGQNSDVQLILR